MTWKDEMKRMERSDVVRAYLQLKNSWPTKCVEEVVKSGTSHWARLGAEIRRGYDWIKISPREVLVLSNIWSGAACGLTCLPLI